MIRLHLGVRFLGLAVFILWSGGPTRAGDSGGGVSWGQFRGSGSQGAAVGMSYPEALDAGHVRWRAAVPLGHSSPCVVGDRIFLTGASDGELATLCFGRRDGQVLWRRAVSVGATERVHEINSLASPTPASDGERVYVHFGSFGLICYDLDGAEVWRRERPVAKNTFGTGASPTLVGDRLIFLNDQQFEPSLELIDGPTGTTIWKRDRSTFGSGWSSPVVRRSGDVTEVIVYGAWWLTAYDLADGTERWAVPGLTDEPCITPALGDGLVFVTSYNMRTNPEVIGLPEFSSLLEAHDTDHDGQLSKTEADANVSVLSRHDADGEGDHPLRIFFRFLDENRDGQITTGEWRKIVDWVDGFKHKNAVAAVRPGATPDADAEVVWQHDRGIPECPSPLYHDGRLYLVKNGGLVSCFAAATGEVYYQERLEAGGPYYASPVVGDGKVYLASARGEVSVIEAGEELRVLSRTDLGARIMATPALVDGVVFVRTDEELLAFGGDEVFAGRGAFVVSPRDGAPTPAVLGEGLDADRMQLAVHAVSATPGMVVADIGAGRGRHVAALSEAVGSTGRLIATEISDARVSGLRALVEEGAFDNVDVRRGSKNDVGLDPASVDVALLSDVYQFVHLLDSREGYGQDKAEFLRSLRRAVKPGGVVVVTYVTSSELREDGKRVALLKGTVADFADHGFEVGRRYEFEHERLWATYILEFRRPPSRSF